MSRPPPSTSQPVANIPFHARPAAGPGQSTPIGPSQLPRPPVVRSQEYDRQQYAMQMRQQQMMGQNAVRQPQMHLNGQPPPRVNGNGHGNGNAVAGPSTPIAAGARPRPVGQSQYATPTGRPLPNPNTPNQMTPTRPSLGPRPRPLPSGPPLNPAIAQMQNRNPGLALNTPTRPSPLSAVNVRPPSVAGGSTGSNPNSPAPSPTAASYQVSATTPITPQSFRESSCSDPLRAYLAPHVTRKEADERSRAEEIVRLSKDVGVAGGAAVNAGATGTAGSSNAGIATATTKSSRYQGVYNGGAGLAGPGGKDGMKRERANFVNNAKDMLYAFGDVRVPAENTATLMVDMVFGYLTELCTMAPLPSGCAADTSTDALAGKKGAQGAGKPDAEAQAKNKAQDKAQDDGEATTPTTARPSATGPPLRNLTISHLRHRLSIDPAHALQLSRFQEAFYANKLHKGFETQRKQTAAAFSANPGAVADVSLHDPAMLEELALHLVDGDKDRLAELYGPEHVDGVEGDGDEGQGDGPNVKISLRERKRRAMGQFEQSKKRRKALESQVAKIKKPVVEDDDRSADGGRESNGNDDGIGAFAMQLDLLDQGGLGGFLGDELRGRNIGGMGDVLRRFM